MQIQREFRLSPAAARTLIAEHGWASVVTCGDDGPRGTYAFFLLEEDTGDDIVVAGHFARADPQAADIVARRPLMLMFNGAHGYISASWYSPEYSLEPSTWNHISVHLHGTPEPLEGEAAFDVMRRTLAHLEWARVEPWFLDSERLQYARRIAPGTMPFRVRAERIEAKAKLSQNKPRAVIERVVENLEREGPHQNLALAAAMREISLGAGD